MERGCAIMTWEVRAVPSGLGANAAKQSSEF